MEEKTKSKKRVIYYTVLAACALLLITGIVLTVYFVTQRSEPIADDPPVVEPGGETPGGETPPADDPNTPSGGEDAVKFVAPIDYEEYSVVYADIYHNETTGWWYRHNAIDFDAAAGTEVRCMADGTVESVSLSKELGNLIVIDHGDGLKTFYRFVEPTEGLAAGQKVTKGQKIGEVAAAYGSEACGGEHLHLEITLGGDYVDPSDYLEPVLEEK